MSLTWLLPTHHISKSSVDFLKGEEITHHSIRHNDALTSLHRFFDFFVETLKTTFSDWSEANRRRINYNLLLILTWCTCPDLNWDEISFTSTSSLRVYQFHHKCIKVYCFATLAQHAKPWQLPKNIGSHKRLKLASNCFFWCASTPKIPQITWLPQLKKLSNRIYLQLISHALSYVSRECRKQLLFATQLLMPI